MKKYNRCAFFKEKPAPEKTGIKVVQTGYCIYVLVRRQVNYKRQSCSTARIKIIQLFLCTILLTKNNVEINVLTVALLRDRQVAISLLGLNLRSCFTNSSPMPLLAPVTKTFVGGMFLKSATCALCFKYIELEECCGLL